MASSQDFDHRLDDRPFERFAQIALAYVRSRTADHWLMLMAGLVIGLLLG